MVDKSVTRHHYQHLGKQWVKNNSESFLLEKLIIEIKITKHQIELHWDRMCVEIAASIYVPNFQVWTAANLGLKFLSFVGSVWYEALKTFLVKTKMCKNKNAPSKYL